MGHFRQKFILLIPISIAGVSDSHLTFLKDAQLSQRDRGAGCVSFGQKWKTGTGRQYFADIIIGLSLTTVTQLASKAKLSNLVKKNTK